MNPVVRILKQLVVASFFILIIGGIGYFAYSRFQPPLVLPTPTASFLPIETISVNLLNVSGSDYDVVARVRNPNTRFGSPRVAYEFVFYDITNTEIFRKPGIFYILPGQTKYIVASPVFLPSKASLAEIKINNVMWQELDQISEGGINLVATPPNYTIFKLPALYSRLSSFVVNNSDFDLGKADVAIVLYDKQNEPIALNKTEITTLTSRERRGFEVSWFKPFEGTPERFDIEVYTNVFSNANFIKTFGKTERFQQFIDEP